ncbi:Superfamily II DNA or RNA helicase, SNF2 family [Geosmithia morbida]|uniref:Superfamily II DNA or RNA helicase, SNF2 family n=1 Tax=Geosmithia morbida TaxID=1094350 RepID=A0A9P4Z1K3_9HYPO|nr:Superfamily II DNA or RNA helicase, SNF2 family [Geosmithia morbida]KAF4125739.1 Superfamily II DNA or RNA helicase, SNF2 family [Geosmithia morbida]
MGSTANRRRATVSEGRRLQASRQASRDGPLGSSTSPRSSDLRQATLALSTQGTHRSSPAIGYVLNPARAVPGHDPPPHTPTSSCGFCAPSIGFDFAALPDKPPDSDMPPGPDMVYQGMRNGDGSDVLHGSQSRALDAAPEEKEREEGWRTATPADDALVDAGPRIPTNLEVRIPAISEARRSEYEEARDETIGSVLRRYTADRDQEERYHVEFADGREAQVGYSPPSRHKSAPSPLSIFTVALWTAVRFHRVPAQRLGSQPPVAFVHSPSPCHVESLTISVFSPHTHSLPFFPVFFFFLLPSELAALVQPRDQVLARLTIVLLSPFLPRIFHHPIVHFPSLLPARAPTTPLTHAELWNHRNAKNALEDYHHPGKRKRKSDDTDDFSTGQEESSSDSLDDDDGDGEDDVAPRRPTRPAAKRQLRPRAAATQQTSRSQSVASNHAAETDHARRRSTRVRNPAPAVEADNRDSGDDDNFVAFVTSDISGPRKPRIKARRSATHLPAPGSKLRRKSSDSDIEFEAPRRSVRSTRNQLDMGDDDGLGEELLYAAEDRSPAVPKVISIKEVFQPVDPQSPFGAAHTDTCHACDGSARRGQLVYCQGCSLTFHKNCLGYRSGREHMVTKVGEQSFVLQCRYCIGTYAKRQATAPRYDMCQSCRGPGKACAAFSQKKSSRQEEKLREQNDGVDPITPVPKELVGNADLVLFRCTNCHRAWHVEHLPPIGGKPTDPSSSADTRSGRLEDYSIDWRCNDCASAKQKVHKLIAWRPVGKRGEPRAVASSQSAMRYAADVDEDEKEYLVKWENRSYLHCAWKPGAWIFGTTAATMRNAFAKRDIEMGLLRYSEKDAIPDEYLMPDVILSVKLDSSAPKPKTKADELADMSRIQSVLVKYQGLGYDDVVWDSPPTEALGKDIYGAFLEAFYDYLEGKYFNVESKAKIRDRIEGYKNSEFRGVEGQPAGLSRGKLMGYQVEGLNWLLENYHHGRSVVLADEMGLGKTVQVIGLVASLVQDSPRCWPFLIVVPNATCPNWRREFKQWVPGLRVVTYHGGRVSQELAYKYELFPHGSTEMRAHVVIMSYDSAADPQTKTLFKNVHWVGLVVDEGQRLKNDQNILYGALRSMKVPFRLLLTGTPLQNNKRELFNLLQFIDDTQVASRLDLEYGVLDRETLPKLHDKIRPYFLRRTKAGVLKFLPPMAQIILPVTMTVLQEKLSKSIMAKNPQLIKSMFAHGKMKKTDRGSLNNILMQLRKCLCHPFVYSDAIEERHHDQSALFRNLVEASSKLILMELMLPKLKERGHRVLIFSQFLKQLDIVEDFLTGLGYEFRRLDGQISSLEKQRRIDAFNAPDSDIFAFLLSTRSGGVGINLATADTVIIMDPDHNPHQDMQALSRAHRIGQKHTVLCFQLVTKDSVEERIMQLGRKKMALDHALIESMDDEDIAGDDLESILRHGAQALFDDGYEKKEIKYDSASVDRLLDRSQVEQEKTDGEAASGDAAAHFSYAKVWSNDKAGLEDSLGGGAGEEEEAPAPVISTSVWDRILAQREEEARKEAEAHREILGRGGRRRLATGSYKSTAARAAAQAENIDPDDDSTDSDEYSGNNSDDYGQGSAVAVSGAGYKGKGRKAVTTTTTKPFKSRAGAASTHAGNVTTAAAEAIKKTRPAKTQPAKAMTPKRKKTVNSHTTQMPDSKSSPALPVKSLATPTPTPKKTRAITPTPASTPPPPPPPPPENRHMLSTPTSPPTTPTATW